MVSHPSKNESLCCFISAISLIKKKIKKWVHWIYNKFFCCSFSAEKIFRKKKEKNCLVCWPANTGNKYLQGDGNYISLWIYTNHLHCFWNLSLFFKFIPICIQAVISATLHRGNVLIKRVHLLWLSQSLSRTPCWQHGKQDLLGYIPTFFTLLEFKLVRSDATCNG